MTRYLLPLALCAVACDPADDPLAYTPTLDAISADADARLALIDRDAALAGASDWDLAPAGEALDGTASADGFRLSLTDAETEAVADGAPAGIGEYDHVVAGALAAWTANLITAAVVSPPAAAIAVASDGPVEQLADNVWYAENTATVGVTAVTAHWTVAWVGVGWLAEMRISDDSGRYDRALWFNGFVAYGGGLGWWDLYDGEGGLAGVVEWLGDGTNAELGLAATAGANAGDWILYTHLDGVDRIDAWSESLQEPSWVEVQPDQSGGVRLPDFNAGEPACWASDLTNADC